MCISNRETLSYWLSVNGTLDHIRTALNLIDSQTQLLSDMVVSEISFTNIEIAKTAGCNAYST